MVNVVDDDECRIESFDEILDATVKGVEVVALFAEGVEASEVEFGLAGSVCLELFEKLGAEVGPVDGVYPEN